MKRKKEEKKKTKKFEENFAKHKIKTFEKILQNYINELLQQPNAGME